jgi:hypothetical protein
MQRQEPESQQTHAYEMHLHTREISWCAVTSIRDTVPLYMGGGYAGIVLTDHFFRDLVRKLPGRTWGDKVGSYLASYRLAREMAAGHDFDVLLGMELRFNYSWNDYLVYGLSEQLLRDSPPFYDMGLPDFFHFAEAHGLFIAQAHPFRPGMTQAEPRWLHGLEVLNAHGYDNRQAAEYARLHGLIGLAGSDYHVDSDFAGAVTYLNQRVRRSEDLPAILKGGGIARLQGPWDC